MTTQARRRTSKTETIRTRCNADLKRRIRRIAEVRDCDEADVVREAAKIGVESEEVRLGLPPIGSDAA